MAGIKLREDHRAVVFSLESGGPLLTRVCEHLGVVPGRLEEREFEDGEHKIRPLESVRGRDVYVVQSLYSDDMLTVNDKLIRVLFFLGAVRDAGARSVTAVAPYLCYSRKDMRTKARDPVSTRYIAALFEAVGIDRVVTVDVHNRAAFENAFRVPTVHLTAASVFADALEPVVGEREVAVVSPDAGGVKRAERFRQILEKRLERSVGSAFIEKFRSEGVVRGGSVAGDVDGKTTIIIDDLISSGTTLVRAAESCRDSGAATSFAAATHGVFSGDAAEVFADSALDRLMILDTIPPDRINFNRLDLEVQVIDSAGLIAKAIQALDSGGSML